MHVYVYIIFIYQNVKNGLTEQDWDIPRNIDIIGNHFRNDLFDFRKAVTCKCKPQDSPSGTNSQKFFFGTFFLTICLFGQAAHILRVVAAWYWTCTKALNFEILFFLCV